MESYKNYEINLNQQFEIITSNPISKCFPFICTYRHNESSPETLNPPNYHPLTQCHADTSFTNQGEINI